MYSNLYTLYDMQHAVMTPLRVSSALTWVGFKNPWNPASHTPLGHVIAASAEMVERMTSRFGKPSFGLNTTKINGRTVQIEEEIVVEKDFCNLLNFKRKTKRHDPQVLIVAPLSGHYATLLRGTVEALLPHHNVFITDWLDARQIPLTKGKFDLDDYIAYVREFLSLLGPDTHVLAVCQPTVPVLAAVALMASDKDPNQPLSMTLMGGPVDTRVSKTEVTELAETRPLKWFEQMSIHDVPNYYPGAFRRVYPGFLQLTGFMSMNLDRHVGSYMNFYHHLITGDGESAAMHRKFYNEYLSVMDIPAQFFLQTIDIVFQRQLLPRGKMKWRDPVTGDLMPVRPQDIEHTALFTVEGELDDISARGQTTAAHEICYSIPQRKQYHYLQENCGHYGIFNGSRWRNNIMPRIRHFIRELDKNVDPVPEKDFEIHADVAPEIFNRDKHGIAAVRRWLKESDSQFYREKAI